MMSEGHRQEAAGFDESFKRLTAIVQELEKGNVPLERAVQLYTEGMALYKRCQATLEKAQRTIEHVRAESAAPQPSAPGVGGDETVFAGDGDDALPF
jgi:exodeoxyribonuclease VII small subunit